MRCHGGGEGRSGALTEEKVEEEVGKDEGVEMVAELLLVLPMPESQF